MHAGRAVLRWLYTVVIAAAVLLAVAACSAESAIDGPISNDAQELPTATPQPEPTPESEPTPIPEPTATPEPSPTSTPTPTPSPQDSFNALAASAKEALLDADRLVIDSSRTTSLFSFELLMTTRTQVDAVANLSASEIGFSGAAWDLMGAAAGDDSDFSMSDLRLRYIFDASGSTYFSVEPAPPDSDPAKPWTKFSGYELAQAGASPFSAEFLPDPELVPLLLTQYLDNGGEVVGQRTSQNGDVEVTAFELSVSNTDAYWLLPATTDRSMQAYDIDIDDLPGHTSLELHFSERRLHSATIVFDEILDALVTRGAPADMASTTMTEQLVIDYDADFEITVPDPSLVDFAAEPVDPLPVTLSAGTCFARNDFEYVLNPITVACTEPHYAEVYHVELFDAPFGDPFPGDREMIALASDACAEVFTPMMGAHQETTVHRVQLFRPSAQSWQFFDREIACFVRFPEPISTPLIELDPLRFEGRISPFGVRVGDCFANESIFDAEFRLVDCAERHRFEAYSELIMTDAEHPGDSSIGAYVDDVCVTAFEDIIGEEYVTSLWRIERLYPSEISWERYGDRLITCLITRDKLVEGSVLETN